MARHAAAAAAFAAYERALRPMVESAQGVPKLAPRLMNPRTRVGIRLLHGALFVASRPLVRKMAATLFDGRSAEPDLAGYGALPH